LRNWLAIVVSLVSLSTAIYSNVRVNQVENRLYEGEGKARVYRALAEFDNLLRQVDSLKTDSLSKGLSTAAARGAAVSSGIVGQSEVKKVLDRLQSRIEDRWNSVRIEIAYTRFALGIPRDENLETGPLKEFAGEFARLGLKKDTVISGLYEVGKGLTHTPLR